MSWKIVTHPWGPIVLWILFAASTITLYAGAALTFTNQWFLISLGAIYAIAIILVFLHARAQETTDLANICGTIGCVLLAIGAVAEFLNYVGLITFLCTAGFVMLVAMLFLRLRSAWRAMRLPSPGRK